MKEEIKITRPQVKEETLKEMARFFYKTSVPRILQEREKEKQNERIGADSIQDKHGD